MSIRVIVLDFDGVVVESNQIKHQAFSELFSRYPAFYEEIMKYQRAHNSVGRHQKFRYIMETIMHIPFSQVLADEWAMQYAAMTRSKIISCPFVPGVPEFLARFQKYYPLFLASATPLDELEIIVRDRDLSPFFTGIYGAPVKKPEIFSRIAQKSDLLPGEILFIGDSREDYLAAQEYGCHFIARISDYSFNEENTVRFHDLYEIKTYIVNCLMTRG
jgi:HAD superfamily hydrolase (TIGR01549 family)